MPKSFLVVRAIVSDPTKRTALMKPVPPGASA